MIATILTAGRLALAITSTWHVAPSRAFPAALAIESVRGDWPAELVAAIAYHESAFRLDATGKRGECGPMQVAHYRDRARLCSAARSDVFAAYRQGVERLGVALAYCHRRPTCALNVYAIGPAGRSVRGESEAAREFRELAWQLSKEVGES